MTSSIVERLNAAAEELRSENTNLQFLVDAHRPQVQETLLVLLGTLCLVPLPGVGVVVGVALCTMALMTWRGAREMRLPARFAEFGLSRTLALRVLRLLARFHDLAARTHRPRMQALVDRFSSRIMAAAVALMGALIALPIPLGNLLPGLALVFAGLGMLRRDGLALLLGAGCALLGIVWPLALAVAAWSSLDGLLVRAIGA